MGFDNEISKEYDLNLSCFGDDDDIDDLYHELYDSLVKAKKDLKDKLVENALLHENVKQLEKENHNLNMLVERLLIENRHYSKCEACKAKNDKLSRALQSFTNSKNRPNEMLDNQQKF